MIGGRGALLSDGWRVTVPKLVFHELGDKVNIDGYYVGELQVTVTVRVTNAGRRTRRLALADVQVAAAGEQAPTFSDTRWMTDEVLYGLIAPGKSRKGTFGYLLRKDARHDLQVTVLPMGAQEAAVLLMPRRAASHVPSAPYRGGLA